MAQSHTVMALPRRALANMSEKELRAAERTLANGTWAITVGAIVLSMITVTPLVMMVTPDKYDWTAPILPLVVDAAVVIVIRLDAIVSRLGDTGGFWPALLRWMTGAMTVALNVGLSWLHGDWVGVAVHSVAPLLLIVTAESSLAYRRAITRSLDRIAAEAEKAAEKQRADAHAAAETQRVEREREEDRQAAKERDARERAEKQEQDRQAAEERRLREEREYERQMEQDRADREERRQQQEREHLLRLEQERTARDAAARQAAQAKEERERREAAAAAARTATVDAAARPRVSVAAETVKARRVVVRDVSLDEFPGLDDDQKEAALYAIYRQARDESAYEDWADDPRFKQNGDLNGSQLGVRLGRTPAAGRTNVKPKFERWYKEELEKRQQEAGAEEKELVSA